ncbi:MAG: low molecular weight phosphatase family protein [Roseiflexaceae bacterium]|nr:low molecular weight phosphatase family protein [Roseiflexaceae bacterium]
MEHQERTVLFVCTGNYYRSRYAEYLFNATIPPELNWRAESRGFEPSPQNPGPISSDTAKRLRERGIAPEQFREPLQLTEADLEQADLVVMLDENEHRPYLQNGFAVWEQRVTYWQVADLLWGFTPDQALSLIDQEVAQLIKELS